MMKKSLIALAVLGSFAGAAAAQSSVTLYGLVDVGYGQENGGKYETSSDTPTKFQQVGNGNSTSRWGLKGSEDLGNGLKANFKLEQGIDPENGAQKKNGNNSGFDRAAWVGLSGSFGEVRMGRQDSMGDTILGNFDLAGQPNIGSSYSNAGIAGEGDNYTGTRRDSELVYITPTISGFTGALGYVNKFDLANSTGLTKDQTKQVWALGGLYTYGGLTLGGSYESKLLDKDVVTALTGVDGDSSSAAWGLGAKYDFGSFVVSANYFDNHFKSDGKGYGLGVAVPIGAFTVGTQVAYNYDAYAYDDNGNVKKYKPLAGELFASYAFSKRTSAYVNYGRIDGDAQQYNGKDEDNDVLKNSWAVGLIHKF